MTVELLGDADYLACLQPVFAAPATGTRVCGADGPFIVRLDVDARCVVVSPETQGPATGFVCVETCSSLEPAICHQTYFEVRQFPACAPEMLPGDSLRLGVDVTEVCLGGGTDLRGYRVAVGGEARTRPGRPGECGTEEEGDPGEVYDYYDLSEGLPGIDEGAGVTLREWTVGIDQFRNRTYDNVDELVAQMNLWDRRMTWSYDASRVGIIGSAALGGAGALKLTVGGESRDVPLGQLAIGATDAGFVPGTVLELTGGGWRELSLVDTGETCAQRIQVFRAFDAPPVPTTERITVAADGGSTRHCVALDELGEAPLTIGLCGGSRPAGTVTFRDYVCLDYAPAPGFEGVDSVCVVACAQRGERCDTTYFLFEVEPPAPDCGTGAWDASVLAFETVDCERDTVVCVPFARMGLRGLALTLDGAPHAEGAPCDAEAGTYGLPLATGAHRLTATWEGGACTDELLLEVSCVPRSDTLSRDTMSVDTLAPEPIDSLPDLTDPITSEPTSAPGARADRLFVRVGGEASVEVLVNDVNAERLTVVELTAAPLAGTAVLTSGGLLTYTSDGRDCRLVDTLSYRICGEEGTCDTTAVYVEVACAPFPPMIGFSPNGDGRNDEMVIDGLEAFPEAKVSVFNRWGNVVFEAVGYGNDWGGQWSGKHLPDEVYYYIVEGAGDAPHTGMVVIQR